MSNDNEVLVKVEGVSKIFCRDLKKSLWYGLKDSAHDLLSWGRADRGSLIEDRGSEIADPRSQIADGPCEALSNPKFKIQNLKFTRRPLRAGEFLAVDNVSFTLRRGECLGLIGRNGAGKTTLLKMLNGLIKPDAGRIEMRGRIGALIALGSGFNPILSGRENIYINGSILGLTKKEIDAKIDEIIDFAEIGEFIDSPVQSYSSGMQVRLGFAVATAMKPDVLLLDEVLAVGDVRFQAKCFSRIRHLKDSCAMIFVSHSQSSVSRVCESGIYLKNGYVHATGNVDDVLFIYETENLAETAHTVNSIQITRSGTIGLNLISATVHQIPTAQEASRFHHTALSAEVVIERMLPINECILDLVFRGLDGVAVAECPIMVNLSSTPIGDTKSVRFMINPLPLRTGNYICSLFIMDLSCLTHYDTILNFHTIQVQNDSKFTSPIQLDSTPLDHK